MAHYQIGCHVRDAMAMINGIAAEDRPAVESTKHVEKQLKADPIRE